MPSSDFSKSSGWVVLSEIESRIKHKIEAVGVPLKDWDIKINYGIKTGFNEAFIIDGEKRKELLKKCPEAAEIIRPILFGENIKRYSCKWNNTWLINAHNGIKSQHIHRVNVTQDYPEIYKHLLQYRDRLEKRNDKGDHWTNLRNCAYLKDFSKPKIIYPEITKFINFFYDSEGAYLTNNKCFILTGTHLEYLTCFFNSRLFRYCFINNFPELLGGTRELRKIFFEKIPVLRISNDQNKVFASLITEISKDDQIDKSNTEEKINRELYRLYNLSDGDVSLINEFHELWLKA